MSNQILISYDAVYSKCRELHGNLSNESRDMSGGYRQLQSSLSRMDGSTNAAIRETMEVSQQRTMAVVDVYQHLLTVMENTTREAEQEERRISHVFNSLTSSRTLEGGIN